MSGTIERTLTIGIVIGLMGTGLCARAGGDGKKGVRVLIRGDNYCGVGDRGGKPTNARDKGCKAHDDDYSRLKSKGVNPYSFRSGNRGVIEADLKLANRARAARRSSTSKREKAKSLAVEVYMRTKAASNAYSNGRKQIKQLKRRVVRNAFEKLAKKRNRRK